jgi:hypothetical protein
VRRASLSADHRMKGHVYARIGRRRGCLVDILSGRRLGPFNAAGSAGRPVGDDEHAMGVADCTVEVPYGGRSLHRARFDDVDLRRCGSQDAKPGSEHRHRRAPH